MTYIASLQRAAWKSRAIVATLAVLLVAVCIMSFAVGRFSVSPVQVVRILLSPFVEVQPDWSSGEYSVVLNIRLPRILAAVLVGGALAVSGAAYQTVFRNPLSLPIFSGFRPPRGSAVHWRCFSASAAFRCRVWPLASGSWQRSCQWGSVG